VLGHTRRSSSRQRHGAVALAAVAVTTGAVSLIDLLSGLYSSCIPGQRVLELSRFNRGTLLFPVRLSSAARKHEKPGENAYRRDNNPRAIMSLIPEVHRNSPPGIPDRPVASARTARAPG